MPFGDGTGPEGFGPMTGRGAGYCAGFNRPGYMNPYVRGGRGGYGRGRGRGYGRGMGYGRGYAWRSVRYYPQPNYPAQPPAYQGKPVNKEDEIEYLKNCINAAQQDINEMEKRLNELQNE